MFEFLIVNKELFIFIVFLSLFLLYNKKKVEVQGSFLLYIILYKTTWGLQLMDKWAKKYPKLFLWLAYLSYGVGVVGILGSLVLLLWSLHIVLQLDLSAGGGLVLPLKTESGLSGAVPVFYIPFWYWIIALFVMATVHEFAHGVIARRFKEKVKSSGFAFLGIVAPILPAAFVELDEKKLAKQKDWKQIAILGAGSTSNFLFGIFFLLVYLFAVGPMLEKTQDIGPISFSNVSNQSELLTYSITSGSILSINGNTSVEYHYTIFNNLSENQELNMSIMTLENQTINVTIHTYYDATYNRSMIGITGLHTEIKPKKEYEYLGSLPRHIERVIYYLWMLNISIGIMNLLPLWITDGGKISRILCVRLFKKTLGLKINTLLNWFALVLVIVTLYPELLKIIFG
jgi:membrane-associated protease RseP (regulator of RpoE activity)